MEKSRSNLKNKIAEILFQAAFVVEILLLCANDAGLNVPGRERLMQLLILVFSVVACLTCSKWQEWCIAGGICLLAVLCYITSGSDYYLQVFMFLLAGIRISGKKVVKPYFYILLSVILLLAVLSAAGVWGQLAITEDFERGGVETRYTFGYGHPNVFCSRVFTLLALAIILFFEKIKWYVYVLLTVLNLVLFSFAGSRTGMLCIQLLLVLALIVCLFPKLARTKTALFFGVAEGPCMLALSIGMVAWFKWCAGNSEDLWNSLIGKINNMLTGRINLAAVNASWEDWTLLPKSGSSGVVDMGYMKMGAVWGILLLLLYVGYMGYCFYINWKNMNLGVLVVLLTYGVFSFVESHATSMFFVYNLVFVCGIGIGEKKTQGESNA